MANKLKGVVWDKYLGTELNEVTLFFDRPAKNTEVGEFDIPEEEMHMAFYSSRESDGLLTWVSVVNPEDVYLNGGTLPTVPITVKGKEYSLKEVIELLVAAEQP